MRKYFYIVIGVLACIFVPAQNAAASIIAFEPLPTSDSSRGSAHSVDDPVIAPADIFILANTPNWFRAPIASGDRWTWANDPATTIGTDSWNGVVPTDAGPNQRPHFGLWSALDTDPAFRIILTPGEPAILAPEPGSIALIGLGLLSLVLIIRRHFDHA